MEITLEQAFASIIRYVQDHATAGDKLYFDELPESFVVPSIYFPVPVTESSKATFDTWLTEIYVDVWFMGATDWAASNEACKIRDALLSDECCIDIYEVNGNTSGKKMRLTPPRTSKISERCMKLTVRLRHYHGFTKDEKSINSIHINGPVSTDIVTDAWISAHADLEEEQEADNG